MTTAITPNHYLQIELTSHKLHKHIILTADSESFGLSTSAELEGIFVSASVFATASSLMGAASDLVSVLLATAAAESSSASSFSISSDCAPSSSPSPAPSTSTCQH